MVNNTHPAWYALFEAKDNLPKLGSLDIEGCYNEISKACETGETAVLSIWPKSAHDILSARATIDDTVQQITQNYFDAIKTSIKTIRYECATGVRKGSDRFVDSDLDYEIDAFKRRIRQALEALAVQSDT